MAQRIHERLLAILAGDRPDATLFRSSLQELRREGVLACSMAVGYLTGMELPEADAERFLDRVFRRRRELARALDRDPGLRVAVADVLRRASGCPAVSLAPERLPGCRDLRVVLNHEIQRCRRTGSGFALLLLRVPREGKPARGRVLGLVLREADEVLDPGDGRFAAIFPETDRLGARAAARRIRRAVQGTMQGRTTQTGADAPRAPAAGVAVYPEDAHDSSGLVHRADEALRAAERSGGDRVCLHHTGRRRWVRYPPGYGTGVWIGIRGQPATARVGAVDLGRGGILLRSRVALHPGERVQIGFSATPEVQPPAPGTAAEARVVRAQRDRWQAEFFRVGIAFGVPLPEHRLLALVNRTGIRPRPGRGEVA